MISTPTIPTLTSPKLLDVVLQEINTKLSTQLTWLNSTFLKAQRLEKTKDRSTYSYPSVFIGQNDYLALYPDEHIGNFTFWDISDGQEIENPTKSGSLVLIDFGLVLWCDLRDLYGSEWQTYSVENVKSDVLKILKYSTFKESSIRVVRIFEEAKNIYKNYSIEEIESQFLMRPYLGLRFEGQIKYLENLKC